jgi:hypothetical protein
LAISLRSAPLASACRVNSTSSLFSASSRVN